MPVDNNIYVMKEIPFQDSSSLSKVQQEKQNMKSLSHRNICSYVDSFIAQGNKLFLIMEYCDRGDLEQYLTRVKTMNATMLKGPGTSVTAATMFELGESKVWRFFLQICLALETIHDKGIVHADLKPSNLLMSGRDYIIKLTDFGVSSSEI